MIHRAVVGSLERFIAIILENTNGWLPLFVTPIQLAILPVSEKFVDHSNRIKGELQKLGVRVIVDGSDNFETKLLVNDIYFLAPCWGFCPCWGLYICWGSAPAWPHLSRALKYKVG